MKTHKEIAAAFLQMVTSGQVREAYEKYVSPDFRHHNAYFKGDRQTLMAGMEENGVKFPNKVFEVKRLLADGDLVTAHSRLKLAPDMPDMAVVHIFRFEGDMIVEEWDLGQVIPVDSPNENGVFQRHSRAPGP